MRDANQKSGVSDGSLENIALEARGRASSQYQDARGVPLRLMPLSNDKPEQILGGGLRGLYVQRVLLRIGSAGGCFPVLLAGCVGVVFIAAVVATFTVTSSLMIGCAVIATIWVVLCVAMICVLEVVPFRRPKQWMNRQVARNGLCFACGYDVSELKVASDGCVQCPECSAAWRVTRPLED